MGGRAACDPQPGALRCRIGGSPCCNVLWRKPSQSQQHAVFSPLKTAKEGDRESERESERDSLSKVYSVASWDLVGCRLARWSQWQLNDGSASGVPTARGHIPDSLMNSRKFNSDKAVALKVSSGRGSRPWVTSTAVL